MNYSKIILVLLLGFFALSGCTSDKKNPVVVKKDGTVVQEKKTKKAPKSESTSKEVQKKVLPPSKKESTTQKQAPKQTTTRVEMDKPDPAPKSTSASRGSASAITNAVNKVRTKGCQCGGKRYSPAPPLSWNAQLANAATNHSKSMARSKKLSHGDIGRSLKNAGYSFADAAQSIAKQGNSYDQVLAFWLKSERNCADIMKPGLREIGIGFDNGYWTQLLGKRLSGAPASSSTASSSGSSSSSGNSYTAAIPNLKSEMLAAVNHLRKNGCMCGSKRFNPVPPLRWNSKLESSARKHAQDMARRNQLSHTGGDGSKVATRAKREGYNYRSLGENVSKSKPSVQAAVNSWKSSPPHCENMMKADFKEFGAAKVGAYWAQNFGSQ